MKQNNRKKQILFFGVCLLLLGLILFLAVRIPGWVMKRMDLARQENMVPFQQVVSAHKNSYASISEEFEDMANEDNWEKVQIVPVSSHLTETTEQQLTDAVNQELINMMDYAIIWNKIEVSVDDLKECSRLAIYSENDENPLNGIEIWKLIYQNDDINFEFYMDANYLKIFQASMNSSQLYDQITYIERAVYDSETKSFSSMDEEYEYMSDISMYYFNEILDNSYGNYDRIIDVQASRLQNLEEMQAITINSKKEEYNWQSDDEYANTSVSSMFGYEKGDALIVYYDYDTDEEKQTQIQFGVWNFHEMLQQ